MSTQRVFIANVGCFDEMGRMESMDAEGFNMSKSLNELIANSYDATASDIRFDTGEHHVRIIDNGSGMDQQALTDMFAMDKANHAGQRTMGRFGYGGKVATKILSHTGAVCVYTRRGSGSYLVATVRWDTMHHWTENIPISYMDAGDQAKYDSYLSGRSGCIIEFPYSDSLHQAIKANFSPAKDNQPFMEEHLADRAAIVFGSRQNLRMAYTHWQNPQVVQRMVPYDYFGSNDNDYYGGKQVDKILCFHKSTRDEEETRYIWERRSGTYAEVKNNMRCYETDTCDWIRDYTLVGEFELTVAQRVDRDIFDPSSPITPEEISGSGRLQKHTAYNATHIHPDVAECAGFLKKVSIIRNGQRIGGFSFSKKTQRKAHDHHESVLLQAQLEYAPVAGRNNLHDKIVGIQKNKNQFQAGDLDPRLVKLVQTIKKQKYVQVHRLWVDCAESYYEPQAQCLPHAPESVPAPAPISSSPTPAPSSPTPAPPSPAPAPPSPTPAPPSPTPAPPSPTPAPPSPTPAPPSPTPAPPSPTPAPPSPTPAPPSPTPAPPSPTPAPPSPNPAPDPAVPAPPAPDGPGPDPAAPEPGTPVPVAALAGAPLSTDTDVLPHRRGSVLGSDFRERLVLVSQSVDPDQVYTAEYAQLYNQCRLFLPPSSD